MAKLLLKLNPIPDDEAEEIRSVLHDNQIDFYETTSGIWGLSFAGIWLKDETQWHTAKQLLDNYQIQRYQQALEQRATINYWQSFKRSPIKVIAVIIFVVTVAYLATRPFFTL